MKKEEWNDHVKSKSFEDQQKSDAEMTKQEVSRQRTNKNRMPK